jgi:hypothetical protein
MAPVDAVTAAIDGILKPSGSTAAAAGRGA